MAFAFSQRSRNNLKGVHPDLIRVVTAALAVSPIDFGIIEGIRTPQRQHELFLAKKSQLDYPPKPGELVGRHLTGHAVDFMAYVDGVGTWDEQYYIQLGAVFKKVAMGLIIPVHWGGDNPHWKDEDHLELDRQAYPDYESFTS